MGGMQLPPSPGGPSPHYLDNDESPITLYFAVEDETLQLDLLPRTQERGRRPLPHTIKLNAGDILLFDTCRTRSHRTSRPATSDSPYRVNIVLTGIEEFLNLEVVSDADSKTETHEEPQL